MKLKDRFLDALAFAFRTHATQVRKGTRIPYVSHLFGVAGIVLEHGGTENEAIAALLHDAVEDCGVSLREVRQRYGDDVAAIVRGCTDSFEKDPARKKPWVERKKKYLRHLKGAPSSVRLVSAADKLHNARAILADYRRLGKRLWGRFHADQDAILWYYGSLVEAFKRVGDHRQLVTELERVVVELARAVTTARCRQKELAPGDQKNTKSTPRKGKIGKPDWNGSGFQARRPHVQGLKHP